MTEWATEAELRAMSAALPENAVLLAQVVGWEATFKLVKRWGGINIPVGMNKTRAGKILHAKLAEEIGEAAAGKISRLFGKQKFLWIPKCEDALRKIRDRKIRAELDRLTDKENGYSMPEAVRETALAFGLTDRRIWYIAKEPDFEPDTQPSLL